jgi:phenylacetate-CoA ligase
VAAECHCQRGLHVFEDHFLAEIVDPKTDAVLPDGEAGELVLTTLSKQAIPMIRYRTHDITSIFPEKCECGRTLRRIQRISHRSDDMMIIRGVNVYPSQIEAALLKVEKSLPHYQIILLRKGGLDQMEVQVEVTGEMLRDRVGALEQLEKKMSTAIEHVVGLRVDVRLVEPQSIARSQGKAKRVIDKRKEGESL